MRRRMISQLFIDTGGPTRALTFAGSATGLPRQGHLCKQGIQSNHSRRV